MGVTSQHLILMKKPCADGDTPSLPLQNRCV